MSDYAEHDDLEFEFDLSDKRSDKDFGNRPLLAGKYHVVVEKVEKTEVNQKPALKFHFRIKAAAEPASVNRVIHETLFLTDAARERQLLFAHRFGLFDLGREGGQKHVRKTWSIVQGKHMVVQVEDNEFTDQKGVKRTTSRVTFDGVWPVEHPDVATVPKDLEALAEDGIVLPAPGGNGQSATGQSTAGPGAADPWAGV